MKSSKFILFISIFVSSISGFTQAQAQNQGSKIKGYIYDPGNAPSEYSTVVLMNKDSVFMGGTLSQSDGLFEFDNVTPGDYLIMVRNVEFQTYVSDPIIVGQSGIVDLEKIDLETRVTGLEEVVIKGEKALVEVHPDKMVFNVSSSVSATGNNGLELLSKSPGVLVDMDKNIILQGKSGVRIYINGRPSRLSGSDLSNMLEGMRSDNIESIEIISNPSSKYDAEGTGGIINIILKKNTAAGFNGNLTGNFSQGLYGRSGAGTSLNYSGGKLNLFSSVNLTNDLSIDDFVQTTERTDFLLDMISNSLDERRGINIAGGVDYAFTSEHALSLDARVLLNQRDNSVGSLTTISDVDQVLSNEILDSRALDKMFSNNYNANLHYSFVPNRSSSFTADFSYGYYSNNKNTQQPNSYFAGNGIDLLRSVESEYDAITDIGLMSAKVDYEKRVKQLTLSTGAKYSYITTNNQLAYYNIEKGTSILDPNRSNDFTYLEQVAAAYAILDAKLTEKVSLSAGIRVENTYSLGELVSAVPTDNDIVDRKYTSYFPNVALSYNDQKNHAISASIGRRITRPNYQDLNPFESKVSELMSWKGNPFLDPNFITNYQLTYSFKRKLVISNTYSITEGFFATIFEVVDDKASILIPYNMEKVTNNGLSVSYPQKVTKWWQFSAFFIYNYSTFGGDLEGTVIDLTSHTVNFRMQNNFKLPLGISMDVSYYGSSPWIWRGSVYVEDYHSVNIGIKRAFMNDRLLLQITGGDILRTSSDYFYESSYGGMIIDGVRTFDNRRVGFNLTYKFGDQQAKGRKKQSAIDDELRRIGD